MVSGGKASVPSKQLKSLDVGDRLGNGVSRFDEQLTKERDYQSQSPSGYDDNLT